MRTLFWRYGVYLLTHVSESESWPEGESGIFISPSTVFWLDCPVSILRRCLSQISLDIKNGGGAKGSDEAAFKR